MSEELQIVYIYKISRLEDQFTVEITEIIVRYNWRVTVSY